jgi:hypothetical protein
MAEKDGIRHASGDSFSMFSDLCKPGIRNFTTFFYQLRMSETPTKDFRPLHVPSLFHLEHLYTCIYIFGMQTPAGRLHLLTEIQVCVTYSSGVK